MCVVWLDLHLHWFDLASAWFLIFWDTFSIHHWVSKSTFVICSSSPEVDLRAARLVDETCDELRFLAAPGAATGAARAWHVNSRSLTSWILTVLEIQWKMQNRTGQPQRQKKGHGCSPVERLLFCLNATVLQTLLTLLSCFKQFRWWQACASLDVSLGVSFRPTIGILVFCMLPLHFWAPSNRADMKCF